MKGVQFNRVWEINSKADYDEAMRNLNEAEYIAEMSDDFRYWRSEKDEVARQRCQVRKQAIEKGIIKEG